MKEERRKMRTVVLDVTSFRGISFSAEHFYGRLKSDSDWGPGYSGIEVVRRLTREEADDLNEKDGQLELGYGRYEEGDESGRFLTKEDLITAARLLREEEFPEAELLVLGDVGVCGPQRVLWCADEEKGASLKELYEEAKALGFWDHKEHWPKMRSVEERWDRLVGEAR